jgi:predicted TIM-barrel fold metal-dependent hydrolase
VADSTIFVDADAHIFEPPSAIQTYAPKHWVDRVWHIDEDDDGTQWAVWNTNRVVANAYATAATAGFSETERLRARRGELRYTDVRPALFDPETYYAELFSDGIAQAVVYPTMLLNLACLKDSEFAVVQARAYNDYISDFVRASNGKLHAAALLPQQDIAASADEIRRVSKLPGIVAVMMRPNPTADWRPLHDEVYEPIWKAASDTNLPVAFHPTSSTGLPNVAEAMRINRVGGSSTPVRSDQLFTHDTDNAFFISSVAQFDVMITLMFITAGGVCERFPNARFVFLEANGGWIVPWLERLDHKARAYPWDLPALRHAPSTYFRRQCWISFDPDETLLTASAQSTMCGADRILWASDFPHQDAQFPGITEELRVATQGLDRAARDNITHRNAIALYRL